MIRGGAGMLRHQVQIRRAAQVQNAKGGYDTAWSTIASCRARVDGLDGREAMFGQALQGVSSYRLTIRFRTGIKASDQVILPDGTELNITAPPSDPDGRQRWLTILADTASVRAEP